MNRSACKACKRNDRPLFTANKLTSPYCECCLIVEALMNNHGNQEKPHLWKECMTAYRQNPIIKQFLEKEEQKEEAERVEQLAKGRIQNTDEIEEAESKIFFRQSPGAKVENKIQETVVKPEIRNVQKLEVSDSIFSEVESQPVQKQPTEISYESSVMSSVIADQVNADIEAYLRESQQKFNGLQEKYGKAEL